MYHLMVPDMSCGHCVGTVEKAAKAVDPAATIAVDLEKKIVSVDSSAPAETFMMALQNAGYGSELVTAEPSSAS